jgi:hypothetical protein
MLWQSMRFSSLHEHPAWAYTGVVPAVISRVAYRRAESGAPRPLQPARLFTAASLAKRATNLLAFAQYHEVGTMRSRLSVRGRWRVSHEDEAYDKAGPLTAREQHESVVVLAALKGCSSEWPHTTAAWRDYMGIELDRTGAIKPGVAIREPALAVPAGTAVTSAAHQRCVRSGRGQPSVTRGRSHAARPC